MNFGAANRAAGGSEVRSFAGQGNGLIETTPRGPISAASHARVLAGLENSQSGLDVGGVRSSVRSSGMVASVSGASFNSSRVGSGGLLHAAVPARSAGLPLGTANRIVPSSASFGASRNFAIGLRGSGFGRGFGLGEGGFRHPYGLSGFRFGRGPRFGWGFFGVPIYVYPLGLNTCIWGPNYFGAGFGYDPFWYGYTPCYGPFGWGPNNPSYDSAYPETNYVYGGPYDDSPDDFDQGNPPANFDQNVPANDQGQADQVGPETDDTVDSGAIRENVQLYLKNGGVFNVFLYWVTGNQLHYVTDNGSAITIQIDALDLDRTISENAKRGKFFKLPSQPSGGTNGAPANTAPVPQNHDLKAELAEPGLAQ